MGLAFFLELLAGHFERFAMSLTLKEVVEQRKHHHDDSGLQQNQEGGAADEHRRLGEGGMRHVYDLTDTRPHVQIGQQSDDTQLTEGLK